ncbi:MAG: 2-oxoglutarate dehydrogenase complex dihydrolipoyllysine-residue succinyltransferase [Pseudomonadota bacterium]
MVELFVPVLGESVSEATIAKWYKKEGEAVKIDELLVELETDKVTLEVNATSAGVIGKINFAEGDTVQRGDLLTIINEGVTIQASAPAKGPEVKTPVAAAPALRGAVMSPAASKIAAENNLSSNQINASGKDGRITKGDVLSAMENKTSEVVISDRSEERVKMSRLRKKIAERLKASQNTAAILTTFNEVDMSNILALRNNYKDAFEKKHGVKLGFMSFFLKASIAALKEIPAVNAEIDGEDIVYKNYCDIGVAVGTEQGLVVPVLRNAEKMSFAEIEKSIANFGKKAREGKLTMSDLTGGTFSVSNGGVYGSLLSTPIINPPQSGILGMHKTQERPVAINGKVEIRPMMYLALSYDHRIVDGKEAVTFLVRIKESIENPERLLFDL